MICVEVVYFIIPIETCRQAVELLFSDILCGFPHFTVTKINSAGNCFARINQHSDVLEDTKLAKACNLTELNLQGNDF